jgi:hypothetical protein
MAETQSPPRLCWIIYSQAGDATGDIMLMDHFH